MKIRKLNLLICLIMVSLVCLTGKVFAEEKAKAAAATKASSEISLTGAVEKTDTGMVIKVADTNYIVAGENLEPLVGKTVKVTGTLSDGKAGKTINVLSYEEIKM